MCARRAVAIPFPGVQMIWRSARLSLVVGTVLVAINSGPALLSGDLSPSTMTRIGLTYLVPFFVSAYSWRAAQRVMRPGQVSRRRASMVCLSCDGPASQVVTVEAGGVVPPCQHCGGRARWAARGR